nr:hypothetical protein [Kitasatospora cheerisanensis]
MAAAWIAKAGLDSPTGRVAGMSAEILAVMACPPMVGKTQV